MFDLTPIAEVIITLIFICLTSIVIPLIKSKTSETQQKEIMEWVKIAVLAAEQLYKGSGRGEEKKEYVVKWLEEHNIILDADKLEAMIEAAVSEFTDSDSISDIISTAVLAAEQLYPEEKSGEMKKEFVNRILESKGINYTAYTDAMIEAEVYKLNKDKLVECIYSIEDFTDDIK